MVWPSTKSPQGLRYDRTLDRTILGSHYNNDGRITKNLWQSLPEKRKRVLREYAYWKNLPADVIDKVSNADFSTIRRIVFLWRGIEANIMASNPKLLDKPACSLHIMLWRWCITNAIHSYDNTCRVWKMLTLHILHYCNKVSWLTANEFPSSLPGGVNRNFGPLWVEMLPWLNSFTLMKISGSPKNITAVDIESVGYIIQTRMCPPPPLDDARFEKEYVNLREQFTKEVSFTKDMERETVKATACFLDVLRRFERNPRPHLSLTTNGTYESPRTQGGRAIAVCRGFIERFVRAKPSTNVNTKTWWGAPYVEIKNVSPYRTMCRASMLDQNFWFLQSSFREDDAPGGIIDMITASVNSEIPLEEPYFGLDEALPHQILQWSIEECCKKGYLPSPPTKWTVQRLTDGKVFNPAPVRAKAHFQPEGGNKVRVLGCGPACVTIALQPFAHWLEGVVSSYPSLRSAFKRSYKGWDFSVSLMRGRHMPSQADGLSVFDLSGASNGLNTHFLRSFGRKIIESEANDPDQIFYLTQMLELLLAPRIIEVRRNHNDDLYRIIYCTNGIHMGDPGTKEMLCITSALLEIMVYGITPNVPPAQVAGDDNIGLKSKKDHDAIIAKHIQYGNEIRYDKAQYSTIFVWYCEEIIRYLPMSIGCGRAPWQVNYFTENLHLDVVKMRLLAPFSSTSNDQGSEKNPAFGKGDALWEFIQNIQRDEIRDFVRHTFYNWMSSYLTDDPMKFLPRNCGGNNVPYVGDRQELFERIMEKTGPIIATIYRKLRYEEDPPPLYSVIVSRMASGNVARGVIDPISFSLSAQYATIAYGQFRDRAKTLDYFLRTLRDQKSYPVGPMDAIRFARSSGYLNFKDILENLDRLTTMRISMACAAGCFELDEVLPSRRKRLQSPSEVLHQFVDEELPHSRRLYGACKDDFVVRPEDITSFRNWILEGAPNFIPSYKTIWVPKESVTDSLLGMKVDIPFRRSTNRVVPGSVEDQGRKRDNTSVQGRSLSPVRKRFRL
jgi:hypothetical protein